MTDPRDLNEGKDWSLMDLADLRSSVESDTPVAEIAKFLMRSVAEVEAKIAELCRPET